MFYVLYIIIIMSSNSFWGYHLCFTSSNLFESTKSLFSIAPTRRKHQLPKCSNTDWMEAPTSTYTRTKLFESTNSMVSLAPTRRKHQLPECSSTNWMEAPTSNYTNSNMYNREHLFSLAPPCHPSFSGCKQMEATNPCVQAPTWTSEENSPP